MGAPTPMLEAGPRTIASAHPASDPAHDAGDPGRPASSPAHHGSAPQPAPAPPGHHHLSTEEAPATPHGEHHGESGGCLMILAACGAASARTAQTTILARFPGVSVRANLYIAPIPAAVSMGIETPPPRFLA
ncbi:MAG: hypothetical protein OXE73_09780 [Gammaproteobacteria bacterium]|nr:hypothetical protein [Gammaproteobacteria bacterium]